MYKIIFYRDKNGRSEVEEYIENLMMEQDNKDSRIKFQKISVYIKLLIRNGLKLTEPYVKHIDSEIWELRSLRDRILFAYVGDNEFILLSYFMKQTQKTPRKEIEKAKRLLEEYKRKE